MINDIYVFDDIIEKPYQELIKETLLGGDKPPTVDQPEEAFPWYYISDITDADHEATFQGRFGFTHSYVTPEEGIVSQFHNLFLGLMFKESLDQDTGMLFVFEENGEKYFHMKNTLIPLDVAFINEEGVVVNIKELHPLRVMPVSSDCDALYAIEVNRGWFDKNNVQNHIYLDFLNYHCRLYQVYNTKENFYC